MKFQLHWAPALFAGALLFAAEEPTLKTAEGYLVAQKFTEALTTVDRFLARHPGDTAGLKLKGDLHYLLGDDTSAEQAFLKALAIDPRNTQARYALGRVYYQQSRHVNAIKQFDKVLEIEPKFFKAHDNLGLCFEHTGDNQAAIRHYLKAIDLVHKDVPDYDWPYANLANLLINLADYKQAFNLAVEAAQRNPGSSRNFYLAAKALVKLDQSEKSLRWLERSIALDPNYPEPRYLLARVLQQQGKRDEAAKEFARFRELRRETPTKLR